MSDAAMIPSSQGVRDSHTCEKHGIFRIGVDHAGPDREPAVWLCLLCQREDITILQRELAEERRLNMADFAEIAALKEQLAEAADALVVAQSRYMDAEAELAEARKERDLAIAHDTQPYPTSDAYEQVCRVAKEQRERAERAEKALRVAAGMLSTYGVYQQMHPEDVLNVILDAALREKPYKKGDPAGKCGLCEAPLMWYVPHTCAMLAAAPGEGKP